MGTYLVPSECSELGAQRRVNTYPTEAVVAFDCQEIGTEWHILVQHHAPSSPGPLYDEHMSHDRWKMGVVRIFRFKSIFAVEEGNHTF